MRTTIVVLLLALLIGGCAGREEASERAQAITAAEIVDAGVDADDDCYDEWCWVEPWDEVDEGTSEEALALAAEVDTAAVLDTAAVAVETTAIADAGPSDARPGDAGAGDAGAGDAGAGDAGPTDARAADARPADAGIDAGCAAQPEPQCPMPPPGGYLPVNPGIPSRALCRGACGPDCPATCVAGPGTSTCHEWQTADCQWHAKVCNYTTRRCGSHAGCRVHDACYDACATRGWPAGCRRGCDVACIRRWGVRRCNAWRRGLGPFDSTIEYANPPTSYTYDSTCF